jgi:hypothetical protein
VSDDPAVSALVADAVAIADGILQGEVDAYRAAKRLWSIGVDLVPLEEDLRIFAGLASEWERLPEHRESYERDIVVAADRFRARGAIALRRFVKPT